jgi:hypothetical protein
MVAAIHHPPTIINAYLAAKIGPSFGSSGTTYFFPTLPTQIDDLINTFPQSNGVFGVYDRMFKMRREAFPYIKCEQLLYYFYSVGEDAQKNMIITQQEISDLLDNGDDSAKDLNEWAAANIDYETIDSKPCFFHNFKIYQLEETRDIVDFATARTYAGNKIIIDYDWHPEYVYQGAPCEKIGIVKGSFTCIKTDENKLVWDKNT